MQLDIIYKSQFYLRSISEAYFQQLKSEIQWQHGRIKMFGKEVLEPRLTAFYGDKPYKYSGKLMNSQPWSPLLQRIREDVENVCDKEFNVVLLNYYRDGNDSMGWHSDDEPSLGKNPIIVSLNFGAERKFQFRSKTNKSEKKEILLENGSLLIMKGEGQHQWQHQLPKVRRQVGERINLTFRHITQP